MFLYLFVTSLEGNEKELSRLVTQFLGTRKPDAGYVVGAWYNFFNASFKLRKKSLT